MDFGGCSGALLENGGRIEGEREERVMVGVVTGSLLARVEVIRKGGNVAGC